MNTHIVRSSAVLLLALAGAALGAVAHADPVQRGPHQGFERGQGGHGDQYRDRDRDRDHWRGHRDRYAWRGHAARGYPFGYRFGALPGGAVSFYFGGRPYWYADSSWFYWDPPLRRYVVVHDPRTLVVRSSADADAGQATAAVPPPVASELYIYPREGQSADQQDQDRYECHRWAAGQTGFDPSASNQDADMAPDYRRAMSACLEGRGYTVK